MRVLRAECLALSLALHVALGLWASLTSPSSIERRPEGDTETAALTISIAPGRRPALEQPIEVASLEVASLVQMTPPPVVLDRAEEVVDPVPIPSVPPPPSVPPQAEQRAEALSASPPPPLPPRAEEPEQLHLDAATQPPGEALPDAPAADAHESTGADDVSPQEAIPGDLEPSEHGTPEGSVDQEAELQPAQPAPEPPDPSGLVAPPEPRPASDAEPATAHGDDSEAPNLVLPTPHRPVLGSGSGETEPAAIVPSPPRAAEPPPAKEDKDKEDGGRTLESCRQDAALMAQARAELAEGARRGLTTVLLAAPEDQLEIARCFGEELVLVPRAALDASAAPRYYRLRGAGPREVETVASAPPLEGHRQYRDLFDYEYARLPEPLRELRRCVPAREDVYLFGALLSPAEWALVIARRQEALARAGRDLSTVRQLVLRYARGPGGGFDLWVVEIVFTDGTRVRPGETGEGAR